MIAVDFHLPARRPAAFASRRFCSRCRGRRPPFAHDPRPAVHRCGDRLPGGRRVLLVGVGGFARGGEFNRKYANKIMRLRLLAQFIAVILIVVFVYFSGRG